MRITDDRLHGIIGRSRNGDKPVSGTQESEQHSGERMCSRDKLCPHESALCTEYTRIELVQLLPPEIAVCIAEAHPKMRIRHTAFAHGVEHLFRIILRNAVDA